MYRFEVKALGAENCIQETGIELGEEVDRRRREGDVS